MNHEILLQCVQLKKIVYAFKDFGDRLIFAGAPTLVVDRTTKYLSMQVIVASHLFQESDIFENWYEAACAAQNCISKIRAWHAEDEVGLRCLERQIKSGIAVEKVDAAKLFKQEIEQRMVEAKKALAMQSPA